MKKIYLTILSLFLMFPNTAMAQVLYNPMKGGGEGGLAVGAIAARVFQGILAVTGVIAALFIVYGGIQMALGMKNGSESAIDGGKKTLTYAIIGLVVAFAGFIVMNLVIKTVYESTSGYTEVQTVSPITGEQDISLDE